MSGYLEDLSVAQQQTLTEFKEKILAEFPVYFPSRNDRECLRFLRARKFDLEKSLLMYRNFLNWRIENNIDGILENPPKVRQVVSKLSPIAHHKRSLKGEPVLAQKYGQINIAAMHLKGITDYDLQISHAYDMELLRKRCDEASNELGRPIEKIFNIQDISGVSMKQLSGFHYMQAVVEIDQNYYPEMLGKCVVVNAPWIITIIMKMLSQIMDEVTLAKIEILGSDYQTRLRELVDPAWLPVEYGGTCACPDECIPSPVPAFDLCQVVAAGRDLVVEMKCPEAGAELSWSFMTTGGDIKLAVEFISLEGQIETVIELVRVSSQHYPIEGIHVSQVAGQWRLVFDNKFSYFTSKELKYSVHVSELHASHIEHMER